MESDHKYGPAGFVRVIGTVDNDLWRTGIIKQEIYTVQLNGHMDPFDYNTRCYIYMYYCVLAKAWSPRGSLHTQSVWIAVYIYTRRS
jgi:hypothetical protein